LLKKECILFMKELVSIIIPAYQEEKRIGRCLQSIAASTYRNLEVIVVNDGSTDGTEKVVRDFKKKNGSKILSIHVITISNGGAARARNHGLRLAKGEYIGFIDADDMIHPQMIEKLVGSLKRGNDLSICGRWICNESGKPNFYQHRLRKQRRRCPYEALEMIMWDQVQMSSCTALFRRKIVMGAEAGEALFCPEDVAVFEDFAFICEYVSRCRGFVEVLPFQGYFYCKHKESLTTRKYTAKEIRGALQPILAVGEGMKKPQFIAHKLQYAFMFMEFWYKEASRSNRFDFSPDCENWTIYMQELERYADIYMNAPNVALHKKIAMWAVRKHQGIGRLLAKTAGRLVF